MKAIKIVGELLVPSLTGNGGKSREQRGTNARRVYSPEVNIFSVLSAIESFVFPSHRPYRPIPSVFLPPRTAREERGDRSTASNHANKLPLASYLLALVPY